MALDGRIFTMTVKELISHLSSYPDDMTVRITLDYGSGLLEHDISHVVCSDEWDEQRELPALLLIEKDPHASEFW